MRNSYLIFVVNLVGTFLLQGLIEKGHVSFEVYITRALFFNFHFRYGCNMEIDISILQTPRTSSIESVLIKRSPLANKLQLFRFRETNNLRFIEKNLGKLQTEN